MDKLELHSLSIILSFLTETEGTSFLLTKRRYVQLLPVFRLKTSTTTTDDDDSSLLIVNGRRRNNKHRHKYIPVPVQNSSVLLARLNTKRLFRRKERPEKGWTTQELAQREWAHMKQMSSYPTNNDHDKTCCRRPPFLELLRFLESDNNNDDDDYFGHQVPQQTVLVSYPRSGNTLIRTLLERITGYVTGSDTRPDRNLSRALAEQHNLVGEGTTHSSAVRLVKTHWPERVGNAKYTARRAILVVRNPYDAIDSYWNMNATCSHTKSLTTAAYDRFREKFERLVRNETEIWLKFHQYWIAQSNVPVWVVRYEDLVQNTAYEMKRVLQFILQVDQLPLFWQRRVDHVTASSSVEQLGSYQPRSGSTVGKALHKGHITDELVQYMHDCAATRHYASNYLVDFGYDQMTNDFPRNFANIDDCPPPALPAHLLACANRTGRVRINDPSVEIRAKDCEFGRALQMWRHSVTNMDAEPLPTVGS